MNRWDSFFMDVAIRSAEMSHALKMKVGAVAVRDRRIILCGFNGTPEGKPNDCEFKIYPTEQDIKQMSDEELREKFPYIDDQGSYHALVTRPEVMHAEENLILFSSKKGIALEGCEIYCTHQPCLNCARMIYGAGFTRVVYREPYRCNSGLEFLKSVQLPFEQYIE
jgi:dCMP deaminase